MSIGKKDGGKELFKIEVAGVLKKAEFNDGLLVLKPQANISTITKTHLIIIPSVVHQKAMKRNKLLADWIVKQYKNGAEISSMCIGAFMLASAGLLDGKNCSIHWSAVDPFRTFQDLDWERTFKEWIFLYLLAIHAMLLLYFRLIILPNHKLFDKDGNILSRAVSICQPRDLILIIELHIHICLSEWPASSVHRNNTA